MNDETEFNPALRRLCPDGACVGLIGADGRCGECGREAGVGPESGDATARAPRVKLVPPEASSEPAAGDAGFDPSRKLCDDGACVGVIGANGACEVCGRVSGS